MFICNSCLTAQYTNHISFFTSYGLCEICIEQRECSDIPTSELNNKIIIDARTGFIDGKPEEYLRHVEVHITKETNLGKTKVSFLLGEINENETIDEFAERVKNQLKGLEG